MRTLRTLIAVVAAATTLLMPATAQALPATDPEHNVETEPAPAPDLAVTASVAEDWLLNYEGRYVREVKVTFTMRNYGNKAAGPFTARVSVNHLLWYGSGGWTGERLHYLDGLAAGASRTLSPVYVTDEACVKALAMADSGKKVAERNEGNNFRYVESERYSGACG